MGPIILTSSSFSNPKIMDTTFSLFRERKASRVAIITTAAVKEKEKNKYAQLTFSQFKNQEFKVVDFFDVEFAAVEKLNSYQVIYVCGGNTFYLLYHIKKSGADKIIKDLILKDKVVYIGSSAGSLILSPTISLAGEVSADPNDIGLEDLSALALVDFDIFPHYDKTHESEILVYEKKFHKKVHRLADGQAIFIINGQKEFVE